MLNVRTVFLSIRKRDRDRRVPERPHKNGNYDMEAHCP